jgi:hypothetical protein
VRHQNVDALVESCLLRGRKQVQPSAVALHRLLVDVRMNYLAPGGQYPVRGPLVVRVGPLLQQAELDQTGDQSAGISSFQRRCFPNVAEPGLACRSHSGQNASLSHAEAANSVNCSLGALFYSMRQHPHPMPKQFAKRQTGHARCFRLVTSTSPLSHGFIALTTKEMEIVVNYTIVINNDSWHFDCQ